MVEIGTLLEAIAASLALLLGGIGARLLWRWLASKIDEIEYPIHLMETRQYDELREARKRKILTTVPAAPVGPGVILSDVKFDYHGDMHLDNPKRLR